MGLLLLLLLLLFLLDLLSGALSFFRPWLGMKHYSVHSRIEVGYTVHQNDQHEEGK